MDARRGLTGWGSLVARFSSLPRPFPIEIEGKEAAALTLTLSQGERGPGG